MPTLESLPQGVDILLYPVESQAHAQRLARQIVASLYVDMMGNIYAVVKL